jgi:hypothetical protein
MKTGFHLTSTRAECNAFQQLKVPADPDEEIIE